MTTKSAASERPTKQVRLTYELVEIERAVTAAWLLAEALALGQSVDEVRERMTPAALTAVLGLAKARLQLVQQALRGDVDPGLLCAPHNDAEGEQIGPGRADVILKSRS